ncbi:hypothetical protein CEK25_005181 [Fusarium fujikuroi]|nr:hypothetical protein CEK25_005181 [Fusarium fujikuroi]
MSSTPIATRYYNLVNDGVGITIFPKILTPGGDKLWDGRNHDGYTVNVDLGRLTKATGESRSVDLTVFGIDIGTLFVLSESTRFGEDETESSQVFSFDPTCTVTANEVRGGSACNGSLEYRH